MGKPNGYQNTKNASSLIILITGLAIIGGFAGCLALSRMGPDPLSPGVQAIKSDIKRIAEHRIAFSFDGERFYRVKNPPNQPGTPMEDSPPTYEPLPDDLLWAYNVLVALWGDVDGDYGSDFVLLYGNKDDEIRIVVQTWDGSEFRTFWESEPVDVTSIALEDVNGDGIADIVAW